MATTTRVSGIISEQPVSERNVGSPSPVMRDEPRESRYSLLRSSPAFVILAVAVASSVNFADPDLWMHLIVGRQILSTGHIPLHNFYSYSGPGLLWRNYSWLAQISLAVSYEMFGIFGLKIVKLLCLSIAMAAVATGLSQTKASPTVQRVVLLAGATGTAPYAEFRPQLFTIAMLSIIMAALADEVYNGRARLWPLIPMFALWANLHGGFIVGLGALGVAAVIIGFQEIWTERKISRAGNIGAVTLACAVSTLLNPFGAGLWATVLHSVSHPFVGKFILDWLTLPEMMGYVWRQSPLNEIQFVVPLGLFAVFMISLAAAPEMGDAPLVGVAMVFSAAGIYSSRNVTLAVIALSIPLARHVSLALERRPLVAAERVAVSVKLTVIFPLVGALIIAVMGGSLSNRLPTWEPVPSGAVEYMRARRLHGNILNELSWGAYLIWHGAPGDKVFIDGRCEVIYPDPLLREYMAFLYEWPDGKELLDRYPHDFVLIDPEGGAYRTVAADPHWKLIYKDAVAALFARDGTPIARDSMPPPGGLRAPAWFP
jgi:hypothetical protein